MYCHVVGNLKRYSVFLAKFEFFLGNLMQKTKGQKQLYNMQMGKRGVVLRVQEFG